MGVEQFWYVYLLMLIVTEALICWVMYHTLRVAEYLSGYATAAYHYEAWTERVAHYRTYTDSRGNPKTEPVVRYVYHPDEWFVTLNTGGHVDIAEHSYRSIVEMWNSPEEWIDVVHRNCVSGGGGQEILFDGVYNHLVTTTFKGRYVNYVRGSNSIFRFDPLSRLDASRLGLISYPSIDSDDLDIDAILVSPKLDGVQIDGCDQEHMRRINAYYGAESQIHIFVLLFRASDGISIAHSQRRFWHGGNKNELVICLGIEPSEDATTPHHVAWCKAFSWCDAPRLDNATESYFIEHRALDFGDFASWLRVNMSLWSRKEFSDFKYIGKQLSSRKAIMVSILALFISAVMVLIMVFVIPKM